MILLHLYECSLSSVDNQRWWDILTLLAVNFFNYLQSQVAGMLELWLQTLVFILAPNEAPGGISLFLHL